MKTLFLSVFALMLTATDAFSQKIGEWTTLFSYEKDVTSIVETEEKVFALSDGKLFSYNLSDDSMEVYSKQNGESIDKIAYSKNFKSLIIVRTNGDIDLLYGQNRFTNISALKDVTENIDKQVNDIYINGDYAYISTNFGLMVINLLKEEIKETVLARFPFYSSCIYNNKIYVVTSQGTKRISLTNNILDINTWESISLSSLYSGSNSFMNTEVSSITDFDGKLVFLVKNKGVYVYDEQSVYRITDLNNPQNMLKEGGNLNISQGYGFSIMRGLQTRDYITCANTLVITTTKNNSNKCWVSINNKNLSLIDIDPSNRSYTVIKEGIRPQGPLTNYPYSMTCHGGILRTVGGKVEGFNNKGFIGALSEFSKKGWDNYDIKEINAATAPNTATDQIGIDFLSITVDPKDPTHFFLSSWGSGLYEFKDHKVVHLYDYTNSGLEDPSGWLGRTRVNDAAYDKYGNLWISNNNVDDPIKMMKAGSKTITKLVFDEVKPRGAHVKNIIVDRYNNKWVSSSGGTNYLFVFNEEKNVTNVVKKDQFYDQDGKLITGLTRIHALTEDQNGNIWVGTDVGLFMVYNNSQLFARRSDGSKNPIILNKIKVPRNDGTNLVDILLELVPINVIAVDGANRKWIGTGNGVYVVSGNGQETFHHFTMENSLLPSNSVISLAIDQESGIVYIGTEKGIVSYKAEATQGAVGGYSNVYAYPNPVDPDYQGAITIAGLMANSTVKITDVKGNLINQGQSLGGQYIWDGRNINKERVQTGVYLVFGSSEDGEEGVVTKVMIVTN